MTTPTRAWTRPYCYHEDFNGNRTLTSTPEAGTGLKATTGGTGTPTAKTVDSVDSALRLALDNTSAAQWITVTQGDIKGFCLGQNAYPVLGTSKMLNVRVKLTLTGQDSNYAGFYGVGGNYSGSLTAGQPTTVARFGFEVKGSEVYVHTYDGATDSGSVDTGIALTSGTPTFFEINCDDPTNLKFCVLKSDGTVDELCRGTTFTMVNQVGNYFQIYEHHGKQNGVSVPTADIDVVCVEGRGV